jgi:hypothetical protein
MAPINVAKRSPEFMANLRTQKKPGRATRLCLSAILRITGGCRNDSEADAQRNDRALDHSFQDETSRKCFAELIGNSNVAKQNGFYSQTTNGITTTHRALLQKPTRAS